VIRVLVVAEVRLHRDGLAALLGEYGRIQLTDETAEADVVVLDTGGNDDAAFVRHWAAAATCPLVAVGIPGPEDQLLAFAEIGVLGFVERDATLGELVASIEAAARGEATCPPRVATTLLRRIASAPAQPAPPPPGQSALTARERQIVELLAEGLSNKEIGARLYIEVATVKNHVHNILEKLRVVGRMEAVSAARARGDLDRI
jgi:two-component system, NarL family, nitrate/nitrite response regulator NarL